MSEKTAVICVPGDPIGKPRMTQSDKWNKRPEVLRYRAYADAIRSEMGLDLIATLVNAEVSSVDVRAIFEPPKSWSKIKRQAAIGQFHTEKPDGDNVFKAVTDAMLADDSKIHTGSFQKVWSDVSSTIITIVYSE